MTRRGPRRCWVEPCSDRSIKWGMCQPHLEQWLEQHPRRTTEDRFLSYVRKNEGDGCWLWMGALDSNGYGIFNSQGVNGKVSEKAHRFSYLLNTGEIIGDLQLDHLCRVRPCVRPDHLEPVTSAENNRRKPGFRTICKDGHLLTEENVYRKANGARCCVTCRDIRRTASKKELSESQKEYLLRKRRERNVPITGVRGKGQYLAERTSCPQGHPLEGENLITETRRKPDGSVREIRRCRTCVNARARRAHHVRKAG